MYIIKHHDSYEDKDIDLIIRTTKYLNGNRAITATEKDTDIPYCTISVYICDLADDLFCYDDNNLGPTLYKELEDAGLIEWTGDMVQSGLCVYPVCKWKGEYDDAD